MTRFCERPGDCAFPGCECEEDDDPFDEDCFLCGYDCADANPPIANCPIKNRRGRMSELPHNWSSIDCYESYMLWVASERVQLQSGRKLSPQEMIERVDAEGKEP